MELPPIDTSYPLSGEPSEEQLQLWSNEEHVDQDGNPVTEMGRFLLETFYSCPVMDATFHFRELASHKHWNPLRVEVILNRLKDEGILEESPAGSGEYRRPLQPADEHEEVVAKIHGDMRALLKQEQNHRRAA